MAASACGTPLQQLLSRSASRFPEKIAIRAESGDITYANLFSLVGRVASALKGSGIDRMDRVGWLLPNRLEAVACTCACYLLGAVSVPINVRYSPEEVAYMVNKVQAKLLFVEASKLDVLQYLPAQMQIVAVGLKTAVHHRSWEAFLQADGPASLQPVDTQHPALILFTSGSTGRPKGVLHSHASCWAAINTSAEMLQLDCDEVVLVGKAITHAGGLQTQLLPTLLVGGAVVLAMVPPPARAVELIQRFDATVYAMLASSLLDFVGHLETNRQKLPSLKKVVGSGDSVPLQVQTRFRNLFGFPVLEGCGITEIGGYFTMQPIGKERLGSIGLPTNGTEVRFVDQESHDVPLGSPGEVLLKTPSAAIGYWDDPAASSSLFEDGWLRTGDIARQDEDGYMWFVGRRKLIIVRRGSNIAPAAVERVLATHPEVHSSVVVGVPDELDGEVPVAWVVPKIASCPPTVTSLKEHMSEQLAAFEVPVNYWLLNEMPLNSVGKFDRAKLQQTAKEKHELLLHANRAGA
ncbi:lcfB [Symbiodinium necroappetens]|uniref:LcfB protein n=1 Tax=Symbiodinium necroappetens TaxID=1628268 RepID=A0A812JT35_9DINO|nr:lcfB [Symbiodinium necroappetens]